MDFSPAELAKEMKKLMRFSHTEVPGLGLSVAKGILKLQSNQVKCIPQDYINELII